MIGGGGERLETQKTKRIKNPDYTFTSLPIVEKIIYPFFLNLFLLSNIIPTSIHKIKLYFSINPRKLSIFDRSFSN